MKHDLLPKYNQNFNLPPGADKEQMKDVIADLSNRRQSTGFAAQQRTMRTHSSRYVSGKNTKPCVESSSKDYKNQPLYLDEGPKPDEDESESDFEKVYIKGEDENELSDGEMFVGIPGGIMVGRVEKKTLLTQSPGKEYYRLPKGSRPLHTRTKPRHEAQAVLRDRELEHHKKQAGRLGDYFEGEGNNGTEPVTRPKPSRCFKATEIPAISVKVVQHKVARGAPPSFLSRVRYRDVPPTQPPSSSYRNTPVGITSLASHQYYSENFGAGLQAYQTDMFHCHPYHQPGPSGGHQQSPEYSYASGHRHEEYAPEFKMGWRSQQTVLNNPECAEQEGRPGRKRRKTASTDTRTHRFNGGA
jgi:hypothetical protein